MEFVHTDGRVQGENPSKPNGIIAIANAIPDMGALLHFDISDNDIKADGGKALVEALKGNQVITTLSIAKNNLSVNSSGDNDMSGVVALADAIPGMGALTQLNLANNNLGQLMLPEGWTKEGRGDMSSPFVFKHADGRRQKDNPSEPDGIIAIASAIPDTRAISSVNLLKNGIPMEQAKVLANILKGHPTLKSLCGNSGDETELDMSGKEISEGAIMLAPEIAGNGALLRLNLARNGLGVEGTEGFCINLGSSVARCTLFLHTYDTHVDQLLSMFHDETSTLCAGIFLDALSHGCSDVWCPAISCFLFVLSHCFFFFSIQEFGDPVHWFGG
jgi:hypothetical protein